MTVFRFINPSAVAAPRGYNNGAITPLDGGRELLFVSGQVGWDDTGHVSSDRFVDQFEQALRNVIAVVTEAGGHPANIGKLTIFVVDVDEYASDRAAVGEAYRRQMGRYYPAMTLVEVKSLLDPAARVEIDALAVIDSAAARGAR
jgi:enamine deaminase RidA (YjgF/YER057c/UK114 family)